MKRLFLLLVLGVMGVSPVSAIVFDNGINYRGTMGGGDIKFSQDFTAARYTFAGNCIVFTDFDMGFLWDNLGFMAPAGQSMTVDQVTANHIVCTVTASTPVFSRLYIPGKPRPSSVSGATSWNYTSAGLVVFETTHSSLSPIKVVLNLGEAAPGPGSSGPGTPGGGVTLPKVIPAIGDIPGLVAPFIQQYGSQIIVAIVLLAFLYGQSRTTSTNRRKDAESRLLPKPLEDLNKAAQNFGKKLRRSVWEE